MRLPLKKLASAVSALLLFQLISQIPQASAVDTCTTAGITVTEKHNSTFYFDSPNIMANYVQFRITNSSSSTLTGYYAKIENFSGGSKLSIANYEDAAHAFLTGVGAAKNELNVSSSVDLYWYLKTSGTDNGSSTFDVTIYNGNPSSGGTLVCTKTSTITKVDSTISANANKLTSVIYSTLPASGATNGSETFTATVKGQTGTIGAGPTSAKDVNLSPATSSTFAARKFRLSGTSYRCGTSTPVLNQLYIPNACSGNYVAVFTYQYLDAATISGASEALSPIMQIASGSQMKHTSTPTFTVATIGTAPSNQVTTNAASYIYSSSATLNGTIDYGTYTSLYFCYSSTNPGANFSNNCTNKLTAVNDGNGNITANLTGLTNNTTYYFELTGENSGPSYTKGGVLNFLAKATATTNNASSVADTSATFNGGQSGVLAADVDTALTLFYYTTTNPGSGHLDLTTSDTASVVASSSNTVFTSNVTGLLDGTTYYYELVLIDVNSQSYIGGVKSFTTPGRFTVTFDSNTALSGAPSFASVRQSASNTDVTLATEGTLAKTGYTFRGWNLNSGGTGTNYDTATAYRPTSNITLYAKWVANPGTNVTITFDPNSGTLASGLATDTGSVTSGGDALTVKPGTDPTRAGYTFKGWNSDINATAGLSSPVAANSPLTLYAIWEAVSSGGGGGPAPVYVPKPPTITTISAPEVCAVSSQLTIRGTYLSSASVKVDGLAARILSAGSSEILIALPSAPVGTKTITVTNDDGSATTTVKYSFVDSPTYVDYIYPETFKNKEFKYTFKALDATKYEISGTLPDGLTLNPLTGEISGAPTQVGNYVFTIFASNLCDSTPLNVYMYVDKPIPNAFTCSVPFNNPRTNNITDMKLAALRTCLSPVPELSPKYLSPVIFLSGGISAGLTADEALTHPRYLPIIDLIQSMNLNAQIYYGAFSGSTDSVQLNVYWPDPS